MKYRWEVAACCRFLITGDYTSEHEEFIDSR